MQNPTGNETKKCKRLERDKEEGVGRGLGPRPLGSRGEESGGESPWVLGLQFRPPSSTALAQGTWGGPRGCQLWVRV